MSAILLDKTESGVGQSGKKSRTLCTLYGGRSQKSLKKWRPIEIMAAEFLFVNLAGGRFGSGFVYNRPWAGVWIPAVVNQKFVADSVS